MYSRNLGLIAVAACAAALMPSASPQGDSGREKRANDYVQFLVTELDQWTRDFPQAYNMAMMRPPVDANRMSEPAKSAASDFRAGVIRLAALSAAKDLTANDNFREQTEKTLLAAARLNQALGAERFPEAIESDWVPIRTALNSLAGIYKVPVLPVLEAPAPGGGDKAKAAPAGALTAYVVDQRCAGSKAMWTNVKCVQTCVRDGDKIVLVTEQGKVVQIANPDKIDADTYGRKVAVTGKTSGDTITVDTLQIL